MADMLAARQNAGEFIIMAVVTVLSSQQWQLFFSSMADMLAARQPASEEFICGCSPSSNDSCSLAELQIWLLLVNLQQKSSSWQLWLFSPSSNGSCSSAA